MCVASQAALKKTTDQNPTKLAALGSGSCSAAGTAPSHQSGAESTTVAFLLLHKVIIS